MELHNLLSPYQETFLDWRWTMANIESEDNPHTWSAGSQSGNYFFLLISFLLNLQDKRSPQLSILDLLCCIKSRANSVNTRLLLQVTGLWQVVEDSLGAVIKSIQWWPLMMSREYVFLPYQWPKLNITSVNDLGNCWFWLKKFHC